MVQPLRTFGLQYQAIARNVSTTALATALSGLDLNQGGQLTMLGLAPTNDHTIQLGSSNVVQRTIFVVTTGTPSLVDSASIAPLLTNMHTSFFSKQLSTPVKSFPVFADGVNAASFPGLRAWWRSDRGVAIVGGKVATWADLSGLGNDLSQATVARQPSFLASDPLYTGRPSLSGTNAAATLLANAVFSQAQPYSAYLIAMSLASSPVGAALFGAAANAKIFIRQPALSKIYSGTVGGNNLDSAVAEGPPPHVFCLTGDGLNLNSNFYVDNSLVAAAHDAANGVAVLGAVDLFSAPGATSIDGSIVEAFVRAPADAAPIRQALFVATGARYGLTVV